jgi:hypothetical protein
MDIEPASGLLRAIRQIKGPGGLNCDPPVQFVCQWQKYVLFKGNGADRIGGRLAKQ